MAENTLLNQESIQYIKYMGSKTKILPFVISGIEEVLHGDTVCDLFAGSCSLAGALGKQINIISNDIQEYSSIIANTYLLDWNDRSISVKDILKEAREYHELNYNNLIGQFDYTKNLERVGFNKLEKESQNLINSHFDNEWHLFTKYYSGTWWSTEQCTWIDSLRKAIESHKNCSFYNTLLSSLMFAMAYTSQGTGHYAQYRDAKTDSSMKDILTYRLKSVLSIFERKAIESIHNLSTHPVSKKHKVSSEDYLTCLTSLEDCTIYADPPYCFVHYSRFYHVLETLVKYDYPDIQTKNGIVVKGRYRVDRHQSPFCIRTKVNQAFDDMFRLIKANRCSLALSYSDTGMISLDNILDIVYKYFDKEKVSVKFKDYAHMTMGRKEDRTRDVKEILILIKR